MVQQCSDFPTQKEENIEMTFEQTLSDSMAMDLLIHHTHLSHYLQLISSAANEIVFPQQ